MNELWSYSTTVRDANRIFDFLKIATQLDGKEWTKDLQCQFQIMLIQNRCYLNKENAQVFNHLNDRQIEILKDKNYPMTYEEAESIFNAKEYTDQSMRGRQSMAPLIKLGLMYYKKENNKIFICTSQIGKMLLTNKIDIDEFFLDSLIKFQYPNPASTSNKNHNVKPFISIMHLIKKVNELCVERNMKPKGLHKIEFGIFALSLKNYNDIDYVANKILDFRNGFSKQKTPKEKREYINSTIRDYLPDFKNPEKNIFEYSDNLIRYLRMTRYFIVHGKYEYVYYDLEPSRMVEINTILSQDDGHAMPFKDNTEWQNYIGNFNTYPLPFRNISKQQEIHELIKENLITLSNEIGCLPPVLSPLSTNISENDKLLNQMRETRILLQNKLTAIRFQKDPSKIDEIIDSLKAIETFDKSKLVYPRSLELEKTSSLAMLALGDCISIKPNTKVGDDNEPINTAPAGVPDIECYYENFNIILEVTTLTGVDQWHNESMSVQRHLSDFSKKTDKNTYAIFIAPRLNEDTINSYFPAVKFRSYRNEDLKIIPLTISQVISILEVVKKLLETGKHFSHNHLKAFLDTAVSIDDSIGSHEWVNYIDTSLKAWLEKLQN